MEKILLHLAPLRVPDLKTEAKNHTESLVYLKELSENVAKESDAEMKDLLQEEIKEAEERIGEIEEEVFDVLAEYETEEAEKANFVVEAGAGGDEAGIFARELLDHYLLFFEFMNWDYEQVNRDEENGMLTEGHIVVSGLNAFNRNLAEAGVHRVARIPQNATKLHTSTCAVKVTPILERRLIDIPEKELDISSCRGSGKGGQKINTVHARAVVKHIPSGITTTYFEPGRNNTLAANIEKAKEELRSILQARQDAEFEREFIGFKNSMNTNFERGERIRNYSWSNNIVTDYRTKRKFNLQKYFSGAGFEMMEEIQEEYTHLKNCERNVALFKK